MVHEWENQKKPVKQHPRPPRNLRLQPERIAKRLKEASQNLLEKEQLLALDEKEIQKGGDEMTSTISCIWPAASLCKASRSSTCCRAAIWGNSDMSALNHLGQRFWLFCPLLGFRMPLRNAIRWGLTMLLVPTRHYEGQSI